MGYKARAEGHIPPEGECFIAHRYIFGHDLCNLCHCFLATVRVFLAMCTYHNFSKLRVVRHGYYGLQRNVHSEASWVN